MITTFISGMVLKNIIIMIITTIIRKATITTPTLSLVCPLTAQHTDPSLPPIHLNRRVKIRHSERQAVACHNQQLLKHIHFQGPAVCLVDSIQQREKPF